jgi:tRNA-2-methylthio-N6-dimethylallyladenosine synthase
MTDDLIDCYSSNKKLMPFIHLPIQSGSNKVLKLMNRKHKVENYLDIYNKLMKINPLIKISSDFIVGYPGEEKFDFEQTIKLVKEIKFINSFSFIFSPRPGTKASKLGELNNSISKERLIELQSYLFKNQIDHNKSLENKEIYVLVENKIKNQNKFFGRNEYLNSVIFNCNKDDIGKIVKVNVENSNQNTLFGKINNKMKAA